MPNPAFSMHVSSFRSYLPVLFCLVLCASLAVLAACGGAAPTALPPETPLTNVTEDNTTLTLWHTFDDTRREALEELTTEFHNVYPDLSVTPVYVGGRDDLTKQMTAAIALGKAPDLVLADRQQIAEFASQGGLQSLDKFLDDSELGFSKQERTDFLRGALALGKFPTLGDRTYGFPFHQEALVLFYNSDLLEAIDVNRAPQTWEQFGEFAAKVPKPAYGWAMRADAATFEAMLASRGSALLTDAETRGLFNERAGVNSLRLVAALSEGDAAKLATSDDKARQEFALGNAAYYVGWMSELDALRRAQRDAKKTFDIGVGVLPQLDPEMPWLLTRGGLFGIGKASGESAAERARNAWFFVRWVTAPTQSARWVRSANALPMNLSTLNFISPAASRNLFFEPLFRQFKTTPPRLAPQPAHPQTETIEKTVSGLWLQAVQPKPDLRVILDTMVERVDQMLAVQP